MLRHLILCSLFLPFSCHPWVLWLAWRALRRPVCSDSRQWPRADRPDPLARWANFCRLLCRWIWKRKHQVKIGSASQSQEFFLLYYHMFKRSDHHHHSWPCLQQFYIHFFMAPFSSFFFVLRSYTTHCYCYCKCFERSEFSFSLSLSLSFSFSRLTSQVIVAAAAAARHAWWWDNLRHSTRKRRASFGN